MVGGLFLVIALSTALLAALLALSRCLSAQANSRDRINRPAIVTKSPGPGKGIKIKPTISIEKPSVAMAILRKNLAVLFII